MFLTKLDVNPELRVAQRSNVKQIFSVSQHVLRVGLIDSQSAQSTRKYWESTSMDVRGHHSQK